MHALISLISWIAVGFLAVATVLLAMQKQTGLKMIQHKPEMLPQAMLVRYAGATLLAVVAAFFGAPKVLFGLLLMISLVGFGDAYIYRRAGHPHWMHLGIGGAALIGAIFSLFSIGGAA